MLRDVFWASNSPTFWPKNMGNRSFVHEIPMFAVSMGRSMSSAHFSRLSPAEPSSTGRSSLQARKLKILETTQQFLLKLSVVTNPPCWLLLLSWLSWTELGISHLHVATSKNVHWRTSSTPCNIWVCLKIVYPYTQWLMIIIPTKWL